MNCAYAAAPISQLSRMYSACLGPTAIRPIDPRSPEQLFPALASEGFTGLLELIVRGRVSYLAFEHGRFSGGQLCDRPEGMPIATYMEGLFQANPDGTPPAVAATVIPELVDLPTQATPPQIRIYRELYSRFVEALEVEMPTDGRRKSDRASAAVASVNPALLILASPTLDAEPDLPVAAEALTQALADWVYRLLEDLELVSPGSGPHLLQEVTRDQRYMLQAAGFYDRLPWRISW